MSREFRLDLDLIDNYVAVRKKALNKLLFEFCADEFVKEPESTRQFLPNNGVVRDKFEKYISKRTKQRYSFAMVTINPREHTDIKEFMKKIDKAKKKSWIKKCMYCIEWRMDNMGMHCHMKIWYKKKKNPYEAKREFYSTFKTLVGYKNHINLRYSNREKCFEDYIRGIKDGEPKSNYDKDIEMRKKYGLDNIYVYESRCKTV